MTDQELEILKYPIGRFLKPSEISIETIAESIECISTFPSRLIAEVLPLSERQLDTPYRPGGWTIRQVVNHCADSHMNSFIRLKLALTEDKPVIKPYQEGMWAELADSKLMPLESALKMLEGIHARWVVVLKSMKASDYKRTFIHPEQGKEFFLDVNTAIYAWHCNHHLAHITTLKKQKGW